MDKTIERQRYCAHNPAPTLETLTSARLNRRAVLAGVSATALTGLLGGGLIPRPAQGAARPADPLTFQELARIYDKTHHVAVGYQAEVLVRWGDPVLPGAPAFDETKLTPEAQQQQFGYNNDFIAFLPLPAGSGGSDHGLLCVNHEYISPQIMFPGMTEDGAGKVMTPEQIRYGNAAVGHSVMEVRKTNGRWSVVAGSTYNRRITLDTPIKISGPAAGHALLKTSSDPTGRQVIGTGYNCSGGVTAWGTVLTCEEGLSDTFGGDPAKTPAPDVLKRYGYDGSDYYGRARIDSRFVLDHEPNEPNRFDWVVEIDPYEPSAPPVKRTALGRFSHEAANSVISKDGQAVVYLGDDDRFEYLYRFVSDGRFDPANRAANRDLLDKGVLSVARLADDGTLDWLPLVHGQGKLTAEHGFADQGEVLIKTRMAADLLGATPMDRPEDFEPSPVNGRIYAVMTKNDKRKPEQVDAANPRADNKYGHILELIPPGAAGAIDHTADRYHWDVFLLAGDPGQPDQGAKYGPDVSANGWFACPDNLAFDPQGRLWIATDGANDFGLADGLYATAVEGNGRAVPKLFFACPTEAEMTGPFFTPDGKTLFVSVQHPGEGAETLDKVKTTWPDFGPAIRPRPSVVAITRTDDGLIGS